MSWTLTWAWTTYGCGAKAGGGLGGSWGKVGIVASLVPPNGEGVAGGEGGTEMEDMEGYQVVSVPGVEVLLGAQEVCLVAMVLGWFLEVGVWGRGEGCCPKQGRHSMAPTSPLASSLRFVGLGLSHLSVPPHPPLHAGRSPPPSFSSILSSSSLERVETSLACWS